MRSARFMLAAASALLLLVFLAWLLGARQWILAGVCSFGALNLARMIAMDVSATASLKFSRICAIAGASALTALYALNTTISWRAPLTVGAILMFGASSVLAYSYIRTRRV